MPRDLSRIAAVVKFTAIKFRSSSSHKSPESKSRPFPLLTCAYQPKKKNLQSFFVGPLQVSSKNRGAKCPKLSLKQNLQVASCFFAFVFFEDVANANSQWLAKHIFATLLWADMIERKRQCAFRRSRSGSPIRKSF